MALDDCFYDVESVDDDCYGESDTAADSDFMDSETEESDDDITCHDEKNYIILKEEDIIKRQYDDIATISSILSLSREEAHILLCRYNWNMNNVHEEWFADEERVRKKVGLLVKKKDVEITKAEEVLCRICYENYSLDKMNSAACGHLFCSRCWETYVSISINDGPGCLMLRCPEPDCGVAVGKDMIEMLVYDEKKAFFGQDEEKVKYQLYVVRSYVENNKKIKWCPAPDCETAIEYVVGSGSYDVTCNCSYSFCWNCTEEAHQPVDCNTVAKWILKNNNEAENANWILVYTKPCPKCRRPIEKNHGCMHITCTPPCKFEFCWLCLGPWEEHNQRTGGHYACNKFEAAKREGLLDDEVERRRKNAKQSLEKYMHYYERWAANESSRKQARADLRVMQTEYLEKLSDIHCQTEALLKFIIEAWLQIIECRRVLKWTYAYGYYLPEHEWNKKQFFEYLQGEAEANLERLHQCAEKDVEIYLDPDSASRDFIDLRTKLVDLTIVTRTYFDNLVRELKNNLADVDSVTDSSKTASAKGGRERGSKGKHRKGKGSCLQEDEVEA